MSDQDTSEHKTGGVPEESLHGRMPVAGLYQDWFLDYASYVILERAVPAIEDGLKPVQRRILHAMKEMDDGRFNKAANIIGQTMQYHPHGDASIGDALVNLGQKELLIETQGNWGDLRTGDDAAAPRYIEARLSKFALEVAFNAKTTSWQLSYDGRKNEPLTLPMKFPLLLAQGAEGIAVGLSTRILPHNFCELIEASIKCLRGKAFELLPDFATGGLMDAAQYQGGRRGGKIRVRSLIEVRDKKTLIIRDVPYGVTTNQLMDSIVKANEAGKIKIRKVIDNTAKEVEIEVQLAAGVSPDITTDALYAFTDCEVSISPNACVILGDKPHFMDVQELLRHSAASTRELLKRELDIRLEELEQDWHASSLEKIFIEKRIYRDIEEQRTWEGVLEAIGKGLQPFRKLLRRELTSEDIVRLTEIRIKRISRFDSFKADEHIRGVEEAISGVRYDLEHLTDYAVRYYENLLKKYGSGRERKTEIRSFETIQAQQVAIANTKLYMNRSDGFIGTGLKKEEFVCECSDLDDIIVITRDARMKVVRVAEKLFVGKDILHAGVFRRSDERTTYNMIYLDGATGVSYAKRFNVTSVTRDKDYELGRGASCKVQYLSVNPNGEAELLCIVLRPSSKARIKAFDFSFDALAIKNRSAQGNQLTKYPISQIKFKEKGSSTLGALRLWLDEATGRLNTEERGRLLGSFENQDRILAVYSDGSYELTDFELSNRYDPEQLMWAGKFDPEAVLTAVYYDADKKQSYLKRFRIETQTLNTRFQFIREGAGNRLEWISLSARLKVRMITGRKKSDAQKQELDFAALAEITGWKAVGTRLSDRPIQQIELVSPPPAQAQAPELFGDL